MGEGLLGGGPAGAWAQPQPKMDLEYCEFMALKYGFWHHLISG